MNPISNKIVGVANLFQKFAKSMTQKQVVMTVSSLALVGVIALVICSFGQSQNTRTFGPKEVLTTAVEITIDPTRENGKETFPAGTKARILAQKGTEAIILIGENKEQALVPLSAILEAGKASGEAITVRSIQPPTAISIVNSDGPAGIWTGIATGDEDITSSSKEMELEIMRLTNLERTKRGLKGLTWDEDLARAARYQAGDMYTQDYLTGDHGTKDAIVRRNQPIGHIPQDSMRARVFRFKPSAGLPIGENANALRNDSPAAKIVATWMASPGHRANILLPQYRKIGIGYIKSNTNAQGWAYSVQVFSAN